MAMSGGNSNTGGVIALILLDLLLRAVLKRRTRRAGEKLEFSW